MTAFLVVFAVVVLQRLGELALAAANTRRLKALGAIEIDAAGYPFLVLLHGAWLASLIALVPPTALPSWPLLGLFALLQAGRVWIIATLGRRWTTRIIVLPGAPLVQRGPYRYCRHPNYLVVAAEIAVLPLAFGTVTLAVVFSVLNLVLIARRIRIEERALAAARGLPVTQPSHSRRPATLPAN